MLSKLEISRDYEFSFEESCAYFNVMQIRDNLYELCSTDLFL
jgi:hypothetical protein